MDYKIAENDVQLHFDNAKLYILVSVLFALLEQNRKTDFIFRNYWRRILGI
jgi:hypothetical protein